ncbi:hypothetical protein PR202_ga11746 [Eleusine coracana subsp. coracana]|uniref:VQ domain-containing protein n=1 Tax=Eleusine coracana subsp. coracana TaxID=191504 RepID=A0AAV5C9Q6_ELECO|nr:hypothetical protein QOZ80_5AG0399480 [Eleusine coracana subsp. coracana]GJM95051.1 hypothetical protein PR202_ga11746 [Eleusine coracana subsp. coracana]
MQQLGQSIEFMDVHRQHEAALRAVQKPPAKPWRGNGTGAAPPPPPPKVYRVEPREFRDLVQRLTGAPPTTAVHHHQMPPVQPVPVRAAAAGGEDHHHHQQQQQQLYASAPWFSFPMAGMDAQHGNNGALM